MLKSTLRMIAASLIFVSSLGASDLVKIYLNEGLNAVGVAIEKELTSKDFWFRQLGEQNVSLGYYDKESYIVVTNKTTKVLKVYSYNNGIVKQEFEQHDVITGLMGDKEKDGDLKTPVGLYELGTKFIPEDGYYGPLAFATTYPNLLDRVQGKTGGGIWIHGYPLDGTRLDEFKTRGCIAFFNDRLELFAKLIEGKKVYVLTEEKNEILGTKDEIASLFADLFAWRQAWIMNDANRYLSFYDEKDFRRFDKSNFEQFASMKKAIFSRKEQKSIRFSNIIISPYPNANNERIYRIAFYEDYYTKNYQFKGDKILYVRLDNKAKMKILAEQ